MKNINEPFENKDFEYLKKIKGNLSWHDFIMKAAEALQEKAERK